MANYNFEGLSSSSSNGNYTVSIVWCGNEKRCGQDYNPSSGGLYLENHDRVQSAINYGKYLISSGKVKIDNNGKVSYPKNVTDADIILKVESTQNTIDYPKYYTIRRDAPDRLFATYNSNTYQEYATTILTTQSLDDGLVTDVWNKEISISGDTEIGQKGIFSVTSNEGVRPDFYFSGNSPCNAAFALKSNTDIGVSRFSQNHNIKTVRIPSNIETINRSAFNGCTLLETYSPSIFIKEIGDYAFNGCTSLKQANLGGNLTQLGENAFLDCTSLTDIVFENAENDTSMPFINGSGLTSISTSCFEGCTSLSGTIYQYQNNLGCTVVESYNYIRIPDNINTISSDAFKECTSIEKIEFPEWVSQIGDRAFSGCTSLTDVKFPTNGFTIGASAFQGCSLSGNVENLQYATSIGENAFEKNTLSGNINISSAQTINSLAFADCTDISSVTFPTNGFTIGESAFSGCTALTSVTNLEMATSIGEYAFLNCDLSQIRLNTNQFNPNAFDCINGLTTVYLGNSVSEFPVNYNNKLKMVPDGAIYCGSSSVVEGLENVLDQYGEYTIFVPSNLLSNYESYYGGLDKEWNFSVPQNNG